MVLSAFPWKMLLGPALLLGMKGAKIEYDHPSNLIVIRVLYGASQVLLLTVCAYIYFVVSERGDEKKTVKIVTPPSSPDERSKESNISHKDYDMGELMKLSKNLAVGALITVGIHYYMAVVPALILQMVAQPITLFEHPLFSIYVLNKDSSTNKALKRPFADNSPTAKLEAMKQASLQTPTLPAVNENESKEEVEDEGESELMTAEDPTVKSSGGDAQISHSSAEKRPSRAISAASKAE